MALLFDPPRFFEEKRTFKYIIGNEMAASVGVSLRTTEYRNPSFTLRWYIYKTHPPNVVMDVL